MSRLSKRIESNKSFYGNTQKMNRVQLTFLPTAVIPMGDESYEVMSLMFPQKIPKQIVDIMKVVLDSYNIIDVSHNNYYAFITIETKNMEQAMMAINQAGIFLPDDDLNTLGLNLTPGFMDNFYGQDDWLESQAIVLDKTTKQAFPNLANYTNVRVEFVPVLVDWQVMMN